MGKIRINGREADGDQVVIGGVTGGNVVQSGGGRQVVAGAVIGGSLIQATDGDEDDD